MRFSDYFRNVCDNNNISSIRKAAVSFQIGKSGIERIRAGECDIPTDNMIRKVCAISKDSADEIYESVAGTLRKH